MSKYKSKPIDFTGCHPVVAEHLKRGEAVLCKVGSASFSRISIDYVICYDGEYYTSEKNGRWSYAEPIPTHQRIMPAERAIPVLIAEGWRFNMEGGLDNGSRCIPSRYFSMMGREREDSDSNWPECIIEDVDE